MIDEKIVMVNFFRQMIDEKNLARILLYHKVCTSHGRLKNPVKGAPSVRTDTGVEELDHFQGTAAAVAGAVEGEIAELQTGSGKCTGAVVVEDGIPRLHGHVQ